MPSYISVDQKEKPTCAEGIFCDPHENPEHHVSVEIGPDIIGPVERLLECFVEGHEGAMAMEGSWRQHRRAEPDCSYCRAIREAKAMLQAIKGQPL